MKITFWANYVCPYSYIGVSELLSALRRQDVDAELDMRAYLLDPSTPIDNPPRIEENFIREDGPEGARRHMDSIRSLAEKGGLPIQLE